MTVYSDQPGIEALDPPPLWICAPWNRRGPRRHPGDRRYHVRRHRQRGADRSPYDRGVWLRDFSRLLDQGMGRLPVPDPAWHTHGVVSPGPADALQSVRKTAQQQEM
jgi:hypothetical protein